MSGFVPEDFVVPRELVAGGFRLEPLGPQHNEGDYRAWMSSIEHIRSTPGFQGRSWPREMTLAENLADLEAHAKDFAARSGFTYTVLAEDGGEIVGCVYIYPAADGRDTVGAGEGGTAEVGDGDTAEVGDGDAAGVGDGDAAGGAEVRSWVRADRGDLDVPLYEAVAAWLREGWPFAAIAYAPR
jgi:hypothetical protein